MPWGAFKGVGARSGIQGTEPYRSAPDVLIGDVAGDGH
jgi:hypothetical protein